MKPTIKSLREAGAFAGAPVEREVTWESGGETHTATVYVRPLSYAAAVSDITSTDAVAGRIAVSILDETGANVFTVADITGESDKERGPLCRALTMELLRVIGEVNGFAQEKKTKKSR